MALKSDYAFTVRFTYWMRDGEVCDSWNYGAREYGFTVKPYAPRKFMTLRNALRTLKRENWSPVPKRYNELARLTINHVCTGNNPVTPSFPVYASIT